MEGSYDVFFGGHPVGRVQVLRQGLYYRFICRCKPECDGVYRLAVLCGGSQMNLGVVVPEGEGFGLDKLIPRKRLEEGRPEFFLASRQAPVSGTFVPISPEEPFYYIARLKGAFLTEQGGVVGAMIPGAE